MTGTPDPRGRLGIWLRQQREAAGLTQEELAQRSGMSIRAIRDLERGRTHRPYPRSLHLVAGALGLTGAASDELVACYRTKSEGGSAGEVVPRELPPAPAHFAGRREELKILDRALDAACANGSAGVVGIVAISGMAGVGKTTLALNWAHGVAGFFPDGQLYLSLRASLRAHDPAQPSGSTAQLIAGLLEALGVDPRELPADLSRRVGLYRSLMAGRRMLILADDARDEAQVRTLLPAGPGSLVVVTSRGVLTGLAATAGASLLNLDLPTAAESAEMLAARLGPGKVAAEPEAAAEVIRLCARLPLALAVVAARCAVTGWPLATLATQLAEDGRRLDALDPGDTAADVRTVFSWSYRQLTPAAARLFRLLGLHPGPDITGPAAASLAARPAAEVRAALRMLAGASLVSERAPGRYVLHDLLRDYAAEQAAARDSPEERRAATERMLDHYLRTAQTAADILAPGQEPVARSPDAGGGEPEAITSRGQALAWFRAEHSVLLATIAQAAEGGFDEHAGQLACTAEVFFYRDGHWHDQLATQRLALESFTRLGDVTGQARAHLGLGRALTSLGETGCALSHLMRAITLSRDAGDQAGEARAELSLSVVFENNGQYQESLACSLRALKLAEAAGHLALRAAASNNAGYDYAMVGDLEQGLSYCSQALDFYQAAGIPAMQAATWDSLGYIYHQLGDYHRATDSYLRAVDLSRALGARHSMAAALARLADVRRDAGDLTAARDAWQQALAILESLNHPDSAHVHEKLASL